MFCRFDRFLLFAAIFVMALGLFVRSRTVYTVLVVLQYALALGCIFRMFSRNIYKRQQENAVYMQLRQGAFRWFRSLRDRWKQRKEYKFFRCPSCHALLRVPRGKGKLLLTCRKCGNRFERKT